MPSRCGWIRSRGGRGRRRMAKLAVPRWAAAAADRVTTTRPTWNGHNASGWRADLIAANGFDERMGYGGQDRELGERLENAGIRGLGIRYRALCVHLDHSRGYADLDTIRHNKAIRRATRAGAHHKHTLRHRPVGRHPMKPLSRYRDEFPSPARTSSSITRAWPPPRCARPTRSSASWTPSPGSGDPASTTGSRWPRSAGIAVRASLGCGSDEVAFVRKHLSRPVDPRRRPRLVPRRPRRGGLDRRVPLQRLPLGGSRPARDRGAGRDPRGRRRHRHRGGGGARDRTAHPACWR